MKLTWKKSDKILCGIYGGGLFEITIIKYEEPKHYRLDVDSKLCSRMTRCDTIEECIEIAINYIKNEVNVVKMDCLVWFSNCILFETGFGMNVDGEIHPVLNCSVGYGNDEKFKYYATVDGIGLSVSKSFNNVGLAKEWCRNRVRYIIQELHKQM